MNKCASLALAILLVVTITAVRASEVPDRGSCFLKNGDRWLFVGDSITSTDTYRQLLLRVLQPARQRPALAGPEARLPLCGPQPGRRCV